MAGMRRRRNQGGAPEHGDAVRHRLEDGDSSDESLFGASEVDVDVAWHEKKKVPYVLVGGTFAVADVSFKRTEPREAVCANCELLLGQTVYYTRTLTAHSCSRTLNRRLTCVRSR